MDSPGPACGRDYDTHAWAWIDEHHVCPDCGAIDLDGERIMAEFTARMRLAHR